MSLFTYSASQLAGIVDGHLEGDGSHTLAIEHIITDSRKVITPHSSVFIAINGNFHNGHLFVRDVYDKGCRVFMISEDIPHPLPGAHIIHVKDTLAALQQLAVYKRRQVNIPVVGITGSNGKTTVKEWLWQLLSVDHKICRSPKSFNSQVGVPLSVWNLQPDDEMAVFEAGISEPGEMEVLEKIIRPTVGIFTSIGSAHSENFVSEQQKAGEKAILFSNCHTIIYCADYPEIQNALAAIAGDHKQWICWTLKDHPGCIQVRTEESVSSTRIMVNTGNREEEFHIPFTGKAAVENAVNAWFSSVALGADPRVVAGRMQYLHGISLRMEMKTARDQSILVNDSYSVDPESLKIALDGLDRIRQQLPRVLILSDFEQTGVAADELYPAVAEWVREKNIRMFIGVGEQWQQYKDHFPQGSLFFASTEELLLHWEDLDLSGKLILLKGSRSRKFERIAARLEERTHDTVLEINLDAVAHNLNVFRRKLKPGTRLMAMVKASAYGAGSHEVATLLEYYKVDYLAVAHVDEGVELREKGITLPILVMNPVLDKLEVFIEYQLEAEIYNFRSLKYLENFYQKNGIAPAIHLKIDTGMHRLGFMPEEVPKLADMLPGMSWLKIASVFSHLSASGSPSHDKFTRQQLALFLEAADTIGTVVSYPFIRHIANTGGISRFPEAQLDMVRLGIGLYGIGDGEILEPVASLKSVVSQVKHIRAGESVGYNRAFVAEKDMITGTVPIGYADGFRRSLSLGKGRMYVNGQPAPVVGNVCMDLTMIDLTGIACDEGDVVEIFGEFQSVSEYAASMDTIAYEVLTSMPARVKRIYSWG